MAGLCPEGEILVAQTLSDRDARLPALIQVLAQRLIPGLAGRLSNDRAGTGTAYIQLTVDTGRRRSRRGLAGRGRGGNGARIIARLGCRGPRDGTGRCRLVGGSDIRTPRLRAGHRANEGADQREGRRDDHGRRTGRQSDRSAGRRARAGPRAGPRLVARPGRLSRRHPTLAVVGAASAQRQKNHGQQTRSSTHDLLPFEGPSTASSLRKEVHSRAHCQPIGAKPWTGARPTATIEIANSGRTAMGGAFNEWRSA